MLEEFLNNQELREALKRAAKRFAEGRKEALRPLGNFQEVVERTKRIKEEALTNSFEIWENIKNTFRNAGAYVFEAIDAESAREHIWNICEEHKVKLLIKGKSITSEEILLNRFLEAKGIEVVETDLGERIVQLKKEKPSHLIVPAIHHTKEEVAKLFSEYFGESIPPDPYIITKKVRRDLREKFLKADAGMTGINVVASEPPSFYLMTNEGNGRLCATLPPVQIILTGWEKVVKTFKDALWILKVLPKNSVGLDFSSYVSVFTSVFNKRKRKLYIVILDNGRKKALKDPYLKEALRCIRCGACMNVCPVYQVLSGQGFSHIYMGGIGVSWTAITVSLEAASKLAYLCTGCKSCEEVCPVGIPIASLVEEIKSRTKKKDLLVREAINIISSRKKFSSFSEAVRIAGVYSGEPFNVWAKRYGSSEKGNVNLYTGCLLKELYPEIAKKTLLTLEKIGFRVAVFEEECCGLPAKVYGEKEKYYRLALSNISRFSNGKPTVFICDSCFSTFKEYEKEFHVKELKPQTLCAFLLENRIKVSLRKKIKAMLHIPCHLKIHPEEKEKFMKFLLSIENLELIEDETQEHCCGGAGLYRYRLPKVSEAIFEIKKEAYLKKKPNVIITSCPACLEQLKDKLRDTPEIKALHIAELLFDFGEIISCSRFSLNTEKLKD